MWTYAWDASSMARFTSGRVCDPVMIVYVPRQFTIGVTPIDSYRLPPNSSAGAAKAGFGMDADTPAAASAAPDRNSPRRLIFLDGMEAPPLT